VQTPSAAAASISILGADRTRMFHVKHSGTIDGLAKYTFCEARRDTKRAFEASAMFG